jgi:hypothetical protein
MNMKLMCLFVLELLMCRVLELQVVQVPQVLEYALVLDGRVRVLGLLLGQAAGAGRRLMPLLLLYGGHGTSTAVLRRRQPVFAASVVPLDEQGRVVLGLPSLSRLLLFEHSVEGVHVAQSLLIVMARRAVVHLLRKSPVFRHSCSIQSTPA